MNDIVSAIPCPNCGAQLSEGVFTEKCPSCGQSVVIDSCPSCNKPGLIIIRQTRQRVAFHEACGWTKIEQGLERKVAPEAKNVPISTPMVRTNGGVTLISCPRCFTMNRNEANFCKECGSQLK